MEYIKSCFTCEFGFDQEDGTIICAGSNELYGKKVEKDYCCVFWDVGLDEFIRCRKGIEYNDFYK